MEKSSKLIPLVFLLLIGLIAFDEYDALPTTELNYEKKGTLEDVHVDLLNKKNNTFLSIDGTQATWDLSDSLWHIKDINMSASLNEKWKIKADNAFCNIKKKCTFKGHVHVESVAPCPTIIDTECLDFAFKDQILSSTCDITAQHQHSHIKSTGMTLDLLNKTLKAHRNFSSKIITQPTCKTEQ